MNLLAKFKEIWSVHQTEMIVALTGLVLVGGGLFWWRTMDAEDTKVEIINTNQSSGIQNGGEIVIDVAGAVNKPGVYKLVNGARVIEAIEAAGGLNNNADSEWMDKYLNRSAKVVDGQKVYIPEKTDAKASGQSSKLININTASQGQLEGLAGIGPVTAGKIVAGRPYEKIEDLVVKKLVGQKVYDQIKAQISVW